MIFLLDTSEDLHVCAAELGVDPAEVGQLLTPLNRLANRGGVFAIDNGAYSGLQLKAFETRLARELENRKRCKFVVAPDVVGSQRRTLELFLRWQPKLFGWPLALAIQPGVEEFDLPWDEFEAVFIGGDNQFKTSRAVIHVIRTAQALGKWVHVGRVNEPDRYRWCIDHGVDSIDGSGISLYSNMRRKIVSDQPSLPLEAAHV
jgi:hypothetical protein